MGFLKSAEFLDYYDTLIEMVDYECFFISQYLANPNPEALNITYKVKGDISNGDYLTHDSSRHMQLSARIQLLLETICEKIATESKIHTEFSEISKVIKDKLDQANKNRIPYQDLEPLRAYLMMADSVTLIKETPDNVPISQRKLELIDTKKINSFKKKQRAKFD